MDVFKNIKTIAITFGILIIIFLIGVFIGYRRANMGNSVSMEELERVHSQYQSRIESLEVTIRGNEKVISDLREYNSEFEGIIEELRADRERFKSENTKLGEAITELERDRRERDTIISELSERLGAFEEGLGGIDSLLQDIHSQNQ